MKAKNVKDPENRWTKAAMAKRLFPKQVIQAVKEQAQKKQKPQPPESQ